MAANTLIELGNLNNPLKTFDIAGFIVTPATAGGTYTLISRPSWAFRISEINIKLGAGSIAAAQIRLSGTAVTWSSGGTNLSVTTTALNTTAISNNQVGINAKVELVIGASTSTGLEWTIKCERN